ncbi:hypothetical protein ACN20G_34130 (plasmid) [Streptomyces sp. BI20]|uniref:hypothetical protein n=1 Tax=Streptomyces sp. BI20 TaxID=3403460 RepID=UPI003C75C243
MTPNPVTTPLTRPDELTPSTYDIAVLSLIDGPQRSARVQWLIDRRTTPLTWGAPPGTSWYDAYLSTYAAALALHHAGERTLAEPALAALPTLVPETPGEALETLTFGGLVDALDRFAHHTGRPVPAHPAPVRSVIAREREKWRRMRAWDHFLDPDRSIAGYCAERVYGDEAVDAAAFLEAFQVPNGSLANAPAASALFLLHTEHFEVKAPAPLLDRLRDYLHSRPTLTPYLDWVPHFTTAWTTMFEHEARTARTVTRAETDALCTDLRHPSGLLCAVGTVGGGLAIPGDSDTTSCAMLAAHHLGREIPGTENLDPLYAPDQGCYRTYRFEHDASITTNIHVAAVLALEERHERLTEVLRWLDRTTTRGRPLCKWHLSPHYPDGELARVTARIDHPLARSLCRQATRNLLATQNPDGGWGLHGSTAEETGYAVHGLATAARTHAPTPRIDEALDRAHTHLTAHRPEHRALWLGKTLYCLRPLVPVLHHTALARIERPDGPGRPAPRA